jgi:CarD family transcriptional regulator
MATKRSTKTGSRAKPAPRKKPAPKAKAVAKPKSSARTAVRSKPARASSKKASKTVSKRPAAKAAAKVVKTVKKSSVKAASKVKSKASSPKNVPAVAKKPATAAKPVAASKPAAQAATSAPKAAVPAKSGPTLVSVSSQAKAGAPRPNGKPHLQLVASRPTGKPEAPTELLFKAEDFVVYPTHGVGRVTGIETQEISGMKLTLFVVHFEKDKMTLRVPVAKANTVGMRRLSSPDKMRTALKTLKGRARVKRTMWSRRAQEYEAKINSGDPVSIAEVVRDLHRNAGQPEQSYSERQIYEAALDRLARELAAVERIDEEQATQRLEKVLRAA